MKIKELFNKIKTKHTLIFRKTHFDITGTNVYDLQYKTITDTYIVSKLRECATDNNCKIMSIKEHSWMLSGKTIVIYGTKSEFMDFCGDFCEAMGNYITDVNF